MTLVDTSVWIAHLRRASPQLQRLLEQGQVLTHGMVIGELACGDLPNRELFLDRLARLPQVPTLPDAMVWAAINERHWWGKGVGWVDVHLAGAALIAGVPLWTLDHKLTRLLLA